MCHTYSGEAWTIKRTGDLGHSKHMVSVAAVGSLPQCYIPQSFSPHCRTNRLRPPNQKPERSLVCLLIFGPEHSGPDNPDMETPLWSQWHSCLLVTIEMWGHECLPHSHSPLCLWHAPLSSGYPEWFYHSCNCKCHWSGETPLWMSLKESVTPSQTLLQLHDSAPSLFSCWHWSRTLGHVPSTGIA